MALGRVNVSLMQTAPRRSADRRSAWSARTWTSHLSHSLKKNFVASAGLPWGREAWSGAPRRVDQGAPPFQALAAAPQLVTNLMAPSPRQSGWAGNGVGRFAMRGITSITL